MMVGAALLHRLARLCALAAACLAGLLVAASAAAQVGDERPPAQLSGVLKRIKDVGAVRIGYRASAIPFSYLGRDGRPFGYSIDLCQEIVEQIAREVGASALRVEYRPVTVGDRIDEVVAGRIDLECGATTNTAERRRQVAFSPVIFVAGTRLLVRHGSPVRSARDLAGRKVVTVRNTSNEAVMQQLAATAARGAVLMSADDYAQALDMVGSGEADALAADDILLIAYVAEKGLQAKFVVVGDLLSHEPYGIMFARADGPLAAAVDAAFRRLAASRELLWLYDKWFIRRLPSGVRLDWPMSVPLRRSFELLGMPPE